MAKGIKHPSPFKIKMGFDEALERFIGTKPSEVEALIKRGKKGKPPGSKAKRKPQWSAGRRAGSDKARFRAPCIAGR
ncbi:MAG: hypothetical protein ACLQOQ_11435 [Beijerinckiaceae bacterium]